jgi:DNA-binding transcriptional ArsR family regulator
MSPTDVRASVAFLSGLAEPTRFRILRLLASGEKSVTEVSNAMGIPFVNVSHHLSVMKTAGVLTSRKDGQSALYSFACEFETGETELTLHGPGVRVAVDL